MTIKSVNCWQCGRKLDFEDSTIKEVAGVNHVVCTDREDCFDNTDIENFDVIPEDSPYLEEPWWAYR